MTGLINPGILTNPKTRSFGNSLIDQGMRFQSAPAPQATPPKGGVASTSQALTASPAAQPADWDAWSKADWSAPVAPHDSVMSPAQAPLKGTAPAVAATSQALTATPSGASGASGNGEYRDAQGNSFLPGEAGYPAQAQPDGSYQDAQGNKSLPGEAGYPAQAQPDGSYRDAQGNSFLPGEAGYPAQPVAPADSAMANASAKPGAINWDTWAQTPWSDAEASAQWDANHPNRRVDLTPGKEKFVTPGAGVVGTSGGGSVDENYVPPATPPEGELSGPGTGEDETAKSIHELDNMTADEKATIAEMAKHGGMADPNLDPYYDREWKRQSGSINQAASARGMYDSGDALRMLSQSRESLAADEANKYADYAMEAWKNDMGRLATIAGLQGKITDQDLENWGLKQQWTHDAQRLKEGRLGGYLTAEESNFNSLYPKVMAVFGQMSEDDQKAVAEIIGTLPAGFQDTVNQDSAAQEKALGSLATILAKYPQLSGGTTAPSTTGTTTATK